MNQESGVSRRDFAAIVRRLRWLQIYAAALTGLVVAALCMGLGTRSPTRFGAIQVERIDVIEPDGTKRLMITSAGRFPTDHRAAMAGMLFFNSDGIENGGLVIEGSKKDGKVEQVVHLSMDRYDQDQTVVLRHLESGGTYFSGLLVRDRPATSLAHFKARFDEVQAMAEGPTRDQAMAALKAEAPLRAVFGRDRDESALLELADGQGRTRARLRVTKEGQARLEFLDDAGTVVASYPESR